MAIREFLNTLIRVFSLLLIYRLLFVFGFGQFTKVNLFEVSYDNNFFLFQFNWQIVILIVIVYSLFVKNVNKITNLFYKPNDVFELNKQNQFLIFRSIFIVFSIGILFSPFNWIYVEESLNYKFEIKTIIKSSILLFFSIYIAQYLVVQIGNAQPRETKQLFIFNIITLLFCLSFFLESNYSPIPFIDKYLVLFQILFLAGILHSSYIYKLLTKNSNSISNHRFTYILFFWILFLYNLQNFVYTYSKSFKSSELITHYMVFYLVIPILFLILNKHISTIKPIRSLSLFFWVAGYFAISISIYRLLNNKQGDVIFFWTSMFFFVMGYIFLYHKKINLFKVNGHQIELKKTNNACFLVVSILLLSLFKRYDYFFIYDSYGNPLKRILYNLHFIIFLAIECLIFIKIISNIDLNLKYFSNFVRLLLLSIVSIIIYQHIDFGINNLFSGLIAITGINYFSLIISLVTIIIFSFSSFFVKVILLLVPTKVKNKYEEDYREQKPYSP